MIEKSCFPPLFQHYCVYVHTQTKIIYIYIYIQQNTKNYITEKHTL